MKKMFLKVIWIATMVVLIIEVILCIRDTLRSTSELTLNSDKIIGVIITRQEPERSQKKITTPKEIDRFCKAFNHLKMKYLKYDTLPNELRTDITAKVDYYFLITMKNGEEQEFYCMNQYLLHDYIYQVKKEQIAKFWNFDGEVKVYRDGEWE